MPAHSSSSPNDPPGRGILVIEPYRALGRAIASALRKFAPLHEVRVTRSFAEAESATNTAPPELVVLDIDPPLRGDLAFLIRLQTRFPRTRVLVLAAGIAGEAHAERGTAAALQFMEKPFDLAEFGAAVQALLGRWATSRPTGERGTVRDLRSLDIMHLKCLTRSSALLQVTSRTGEVGEIYFRHGQIRHATAGELSGLEALEEIAGWPGGEMSEAELPRDAPETINHPWPALLLRAVRHAAKQERGTPSLGAHAPAKPAPRKAGKKILAIDDTEMLLIFVADVLATANNSFEIVTASTGADGLRRAAEMRPDLVLLDYSLTDMNGEDVCRNLLAHEATARIPVLMMSGHLTEMANTAKKFRNVVATLAKPFLSGALINSVEKVLAAGPLPKNPAPTAPSAPPPLPNEPTPVPEQGGKNGGNAAAAAPIVETAPVIAPPIASRPPAPLPQRTRLQTPANISAFAADKRAGLSVTFSFQVTSVELTPLFRIELLKLRPAGPAAAVQMFQREVGGHLALEAGFRIAQVSLAQDGSFQTIRLIPTPALPQLTAGNRSLAVEDWTGASGDNVQNVRLTAPENAPMHVQLTAPFELLMVELSTSFEIVSLLLKSTSRSALVSNQPGNPGAEFEMVAAELDRVGYLGSLAVRPVA